VPGQLNALIRFIKAIADRILSIGLGRLLALLLIFLFVLLRFWDPLPVQILRLKTFDFYQIAKPRTVTAHPVIIIDIDEASLEAYGQFPWPRTRMAQIVEKAHALGAAVVSFDVLFPEADRLSPSTLSKSMVGLTDDMRNVLGSLPSNDQVFADAIAKGRVVLGQSGYHLDIGGEPNKWPSDSTFAQLGGSATDTMLHFPGLIENIAPLEQAAAGRGAVSIRPEQDGVVRRVPAVLSAKGKILPALSIEMLRVASGQKTILLKRDKADIKSLVLANTQIPTDEKWQIWVYYSKHDPRRFISARALLEDQLAPNSLAGRLVIVGASAVGLHDLKSTPVDAAVPGVEIHAQLIETIFSNAILKRPSWTIPAELLLIVAVGLAIVVLVPMLGALRVMITGGALSMILIAGSWVLFDRYHILLDVVLPLGSSLAAFLLLTFINYFREEAQRNNIRGAFGQYLSPALVQQLTQNPDLLVLGGETREITVMFSDVRQFTAISETYRDDPQGLTTLMNRFLTPLSDVIMEQKGTIDKYMGDAIMAFWNAPLEDEKHAANACDAALAMLSELDALNKDLEREATEAGRDFIPLRAGIGINTGTCLVGNLGSTRRFNYSALGDAVNLASRIEGLTKQYRLSVLTGDDTVRLAPDHAFIEVDMIRVVGKQIPQRIFALLGGPELAVSENFKSFLDLHQRAINGYRAMEWADASFALAAAEKDFPTGVDLTGLYALYRDRIRQFKDNAPPRDWDGVYVATKK
jgi:adenylate cyclase